ncbi:MAG: DUF3160 domain-containing protein [Deltaproteobacteria bacterium]|nr:DUF3160 domain-containing protein [Deltaproteobacteria bacterium]
MRREYSWTETIALLVSLVTLLFTGACAGEGGATVLSPPKTDGGQRADLAPRPGAPDAGEDVLTVPAGQPPNAGDYARIKAALVAETPADATAFLARWRPAYLAQLPYDPSAAVNLPLIQQSSLQLNATELDTLAKTGLAISARQSFGTFFMGYVGIYANDLPLFVSGDSVLHAVHRSYDSILKEIEVLTLQPSLQKVLDGMRGALLAEAAAGIWPTETVLDVDEYLAVAASLALYKGSAAPVAGGSTSNVQSLVAQAKAAAGVADTVLFGESRPVDFSQFTVRGHYAGDSRLEPYFRAMMWLGRTDLRLLSQKKSGEVAFNRRQFAAAALMAKLVEPVQSDWERVDRTLHAFLGESDNMMPTDFPALRAVAGADSWAALLAKSDEELARAIVSGGFGIQRIASQLLFVSPGNEGAPLDRAFLLLGQRFVLDSQVLSNVVYDRVFAPARPTPLRMMPNPLDVAFAALGNAGAAGLLATDLQSYPAYPQALHQARVLVDQHEPAYWTESLYTSWLGALRAASPGWGAAANPKAPPIVATEAWSRRILQMQLASWAELRHDNLLYAKQSYTGIPVCEFPDAYVEPIPALWHALVELGNRGAALLADLGMSGSSGAASYFTTLASTATMLEAMALRQEQGEAFTAEQMAFINQAVELKSESVVCATITRPAGWYPNLFYARDDADKQDMIVADVHTQPADENGDMVGKVLHVGTGFPRLLVVTFETCAGPRAYAGVVSAYHETVAGDFDRLTDQRWTAQIAASPPAEVPWLAGLVSR